MVADYITFAVVVAALAAECLHALRVRKISTLAFGPAGRPRHWVSISPLLRVAGLGLAAWGLTTLLLLDPKVHNRDQTGENDRHLVLVVDVSPSMFLEDAGPELNSSRRIRASQVLESLFNRIPIRQYRLSVIAVYTEARPVLTESNDMEVVRHIMERLPMYHAFQPGKTNLFSGLAQAATLARPWNPDSTIVVLLTDGDTVPPQGMPQMPASVSSVLVVGVGDPGAGRFIDGHQSRQDTTTLRQIANRLGGIYHNGNQKHVTSQTINLLTYTGDPTALPQLGRREIALLCAVIGAAFLAFLPIMLHYWGTSWRPGVQFGSDTSRASI